MTSLQPVRQSAFRRWWPLGLVLALGVLCCRAALRRDFWFDEALTVLNFALLPDLGSIYRGYVIPNNQLLHTMLLHLWGPWNIFGFDQVAHYRVVELAAALGSVAALWCGFRRTVGGKSLASVLLFWVVSPIFINYATAVRGYALGMLCTVWALIAARNLAVSGKWRSGGGYFAASLCCVATIPSNLAALAGVGLYVWPLCGKKFYRRWRFYALVVLPAFAFVLAYGPIWRQFLGCLALGEGWRDRAGALLMVYGAFGLTCAAPLAVALAGGMRKWYSGGGRCFFAVRLAVFLLPVPACYGLGVAPFPRIFVVLFPVWLLVTAHGMKHFFAWFRRRPNPGLWLAPALLTAGLLSLAGEALSRRFAGGGEADDYFAPYYMRADHRVDDTAFYLKRYASPSKGVYLSFRSDPWAVIFHGMLAGAEVSQWRFDGPRGRVPELAPGALAVLRPDEDVAALEKRFGVRLERLSGKGYGRVFLLAHEKNEANVP